jgi:hypothetical protein
LELSNNKAINSQGTVKLKIEKVVCPHLTTTHLDETERRNNVQQTIKKTTKWHHKILHSVPKVDGSKCYQIS